MVMEEAEAVNWWHGEIQSCWRALMRVLSWAERLPRRTFPPMEGEGRVQGIAQWMQASQSMQCARCELQKALKNTSRFDEVARQLVVGIAVSSDPAWLQRILALSTYHQEI